MQLIHINLTV